MTFELGPPRRSYGGENKNDSSPGLSVVRTSPQRFSPLRLDVPPTTWQRSVGGKRQFTILSPRTLPDSPGNLESSIFKIPRVGISLLPVGTVRRGNRALQLKASACTSNRKRSGSISKPLVSRGLFVDLLRTKNDFNG